ncbi:MAG: RNA polymerase sigma-70 factor [Bacteroidales bacterium]|nr:RNA polymerase sigma-70 factor [Bacteroidales bacterium]
MKDLLISISKGDTNSFRIFYDHFFKKVLQFAHYFIKLDEICEEIVSDVFISVWLNKEKLPEVESVESYLFIVTRNKSLNYLEKETRSEEFFYEINTEDIVENINPENTLIAGELDIIIQKSIEQLPERCRIIFLMSREEKLKHYQIAEILSISENTVHAQMVIALKKALYNVKKTYLSFYFDLIIKKLKIFFIFFQLSFSYLLLYSCLYNYNN